MQKLEENAKLLSDKKFLKSIKEKSREVNELESVECDAKLEQMEEIYASQLRTLCSRKRKVFFR